MLDNCSVKQTLEKNSDTASSSSIDAARAECFTGPIVKHAAGVKPAEDKKNIFERHNTYVTSGFFSQHFTDDNHFNQKNFGAGIEFQVSKHNSLTVGEYYNSIRRPSVYAADEVRWRLGNSPVQAGFGVGIVSGYQTESPIIPLVLPMVSLDGDRTKIPIINHLGADVVLIPPVGSKETGTPTVAAVRLKYHFGKKN